MLRDDVTDQTVIDLRFGTHRFLQHFFEDDASVTCSFKDLNDSLHFSGNHIARQALGPSVAIMHNVGLSLVALYKDKEHRLVLPDEFATDASET